MEAPNSIMAPSTANESRTLSKIWQNLMQLATNTQSIQKSRQQATVSVLLLVFIPLSFVTAFSSTVISILEGREIVAPPFAAVFALFVLIITYALSRTEHYKWSIYLTIIVPLLAVGGTIFTRNEPPSDILIFYLSLTIIFSGLLLDVRNTLLFSGIVLLIIVAAYLRPVEGQVLSAPVLMYIILVAGIMSLMSYIRDNYIAALEDTRQKLQEQNIVAEQARQRAEHSDQVKSAFLASMSHELRTPLNAVINFTRFVIDGDTGPVNEQQTELLTEVVGSARHLLNLINDVLDMSKIESGSLNLFVQDDVNMNALLKNAMTTGQSLLRDKQVQLTADIANDLPLVRGDQQRILQVLLNIISNACKFTEDGEIIVRAKQQNDDIIISVQDSGPGIAPEDQAKVFEAFQQTSTGLRQAGGTGLGMPIAKSLAEAHGGQLWLESKYGHGATFYFSIPVKSADLVPVLV